MGIMVALMALLAPAFTSMKSAGDVTGAAYTVKGVLDQARTYAMANNTYTWVGFFEEDVSQSSTNPATKGTGRVVLSIVASKDGTTAYDPNSGTNPDPVDPSKLTQIGKLTKLDNVHLPIFADAGAAIGDTFDTRPAPDVSFDTACSCSNTRNSRFGEINLTVPQSAPSTNSQFPFHYPLSATFPGQYRFDKTLQFNPRGESRINSTYGVLRVLEIGLLSTHGTSVPTPTPSAGRYAGNVLAVQLTGFSGDVKIYRR